MRRITLKDIADALGLSVSTVSRALSRKGRISRQTIELVERKARELGYIPNTIAKGLKTRKTNTIGVIIPDITNPIFPGYARGILDAALKQGYQVFILNFDMSKAKEKDAINSLLSSQVEGLILTSTKLSRQELLELRKRGVPFVVVRKDVRLPGTSFVNVDNIYGGYIATKHLLEIGKKKIAFIGSRFSGEPARKRLKGYLKALKERGIDIREDIIVEAESSFDGGYRAIQKIFDRVDGVFAYNDVMAIGVLVFARERGIKLPEELAVIGFDDIPVSSLPIVNLTTIKQPMYEMGQQAFITLMKLMNDEENVFKIWLKPELVIRGTA
ncbi:MAG: LacI family DNA-binding transcriptional regulator [Thermotogaceae bacterium]|nr:LacI family DNA-binding transcriptional regulator [Thermotogaceae bacterium]